jgi:type IV pilus assembly protein PilB
MAETRKLHLGEVLITEGIITDAQLNEALAVQKQGGGRLGQVLIDLGYASEEVIVLGLSKKLNVPYVNLDSYLVDQEVTLLISKDFACDHVLIPLFKIDTSLTVALADPLNVFALDRIKLETGYGVEPVLSTPGQIKRAINQYYGVRESIGDIVREMEEEEGAQAAEQVEVQRLEHGGDAGPVVKLLNLILLQAIREGASDIHIEPDENALRASHRVDGILHKVASPPKSLQAGVVSRIKVMGHMDIAETRVPQDGRCRIHAEDKEVELRISTFPTIYGENVVIRLLDQTSALYSLEDLGFSSETLKGYHSLIDQLYGMVLVTGPTGSGKTTTLYASLSAINTPEKNIITIEDPVEYRLNLIRQTQVNPKAGITFANGLRSIVRQDPDVIMVGEIRDQETAELAVQAALTGHLVFSTLHTNDAPGAIARLIDMKVEPFLVSSSLLGVVAQRLVRTLCPECKEPYQPDKETLRRIGAPASDGDDTLYSTKGCKQCRGTGYKGRVGIFEMLAIDDQIRDLTHEKASSKMIRQVASENQGMRTLRDDGYKKVLQGITTIDEVGRVAAQ